MPRIPINDMQRETFASGRLNVSADASSFGFNVGSVGEGLSDLGQRITKSRQDVARFENAATLAKGRQDWMLDVQDRMDAAERGEISYKGMTEKFKSDYAKWAGGISANVQDEEMRRDLDLNMFEMQTTFLGQLKSFESRKMAESVRQNYDSIQAAAFAPIASAKSEAEIDMAMQGLPSVITMLSPLTGFNAVIVVDAIVPSPPPPVAVILPSMTNVPAESTNRNHVAVPLLSALESAVITLNVMTPLLTTALGSEKVSSASRVVTAPPVAGRVPL